MLFSLTLSRLGRDPIQILSYSGDLKSSLLKSTHCIICHFLELSQVNASTEIEYLFVKYHLIKKWIVRALINEYAEMLKNS